jgi:mitochondrial ATPase complex subunit ATP10
MTPRPFAAVDLFVLLARRPHSQCLRSWQPQVQLIRPATSDARLPRTPRATVASNSGIPLNVGLDRNPDHVSAISRIPIPRGAKGEVFTPSVLARPLGLRNPPRPGDNSPVDKRTLEQRRSDFTDPEKAKIRQRVLMRSYFRPYYQERNRAKHHRGKSFVSNERLFKREKALYFPNIFGRTLSKEGDGPDGGRDLAPLLNGKISIVTLEKAEWAAKQVETFVSAKANPGLQSIIDASNGLVQRVSVNMQDSVLDMWLVRLFQYRIRQKTPQDQWSKYFLIQLPRDIRKGLTEDVRDAMGLLNSQVGYVYLVDSSAKIRWAGSGDAWDGEVAGMNAAIERLVEEERSLPKSGRKADLTGTAPQEELVRNISRPDAAVM